MRAGLLLFVCLMIGSAFGQHSFTPIGLGAKGDTVTLIDGAINSGTAAFSSASASFTAGDVGKAIVVSGAGTSGNALVTTIQSFTSSTSVTLAANAGTTVSAALTYYGTDDTAAVRSCITQGTAQGGRCTINDGYTFMVSNTSSTITVSGSTFLGGGLIDGTGTIVFAPQGVLTGGTNDRLFYLQSTESAILQVSAAIAKGDTKFIAANVADAAILNPGDWVIITVRDSGATDNVYVDWIQVSSVSGTPATTVNTVTPFRLSFPNTRTWYNGQMGSPANCMVADPCGLGFRKVTDIIGSLTIRDINLIIPKVISTDRAVGIATRDTRGVVIQNVTCNDASQNCYAGYLDQGLFFVQNHMNSAVYSEFASDVDLVAVGNHFNQPGSALFGLVAPPQSGGVNIDFGTGFSTFSENTFGPSLQACISALPAVHDMVISGNTCGWVHFGTGSTCIITRGGYRNTIVGNVCAGGDGTGYGINLGDTGGQTVNIDTDSNVVAANTVNGFAHSYACAGGALGTDNCLDLTQLPTKLATSTFSNLGTPLNGSAIYCSDCTVTTPASCTNVTNSAACTCKASGTGALAKRINGVWLCN
jgi:hypothetical protein